MRLRPEVLLGWRPARTTKGARPPTSSQPRLCGPPRPSLPPSARLRSPSCSSQDQASVLPTWVTQASWSSNRPSRVSRSSLGPQSSSTAGTSPTSSCVCPPRWACQRARSPIAPRTAIATSFQFELAILCCYIATAWSTTCTNMRSQRSSSACAPMHNSMARAQARSQTRSCSRVRWPVRHRFAPGTRRRTRHSRRLRGGRGRRSSVARKMTSPSSPRGSCHSTGVWLRAAAAAAEASLV
mmetsp:Transcript_20449/g.70810  ORF Transcript_20449/g.70810 Transcript_20449/m.70810 type:complete len:240 (+) Transcript_20449:1112-1831(+)